MKSEIQKFFKGDAEDDEETLVKYSHDASLLEVRPKLALFPKDSEDIKNLVKWVYDTNLRIGANDTNKNISITARCAGTDMSCGAIGESIIIDFTRYMNKLIGGPLPIEDGKKRVGKIKPGNYPALPSYITVEPGMFYRDFAKILRASARSNTARRRITFCSQRSFLPMGMFTRLFP